MIQDNAKVERVSSKKLDEVLAHQKPFSNKSGLGYTEERTSSVKVSKDIKFVKAKEPMVEITTVEKVKAEKKQNVTHQRLLTKPHNQSVVKPKGKRKSLPKSQRGLRTQHFYHHCGIQGHTRPNCRKLQALKNSSVGWKDQDMAKGIGLLSNQKVKKVILEWGTWWRWLMHSPPDWQASPEGLKVITIVPNPLGISPQTQVSCRWRRIHMHKH